MVLNQLKTVTAVLDRLAPWLTYGAGLLFIVAAIFELPLVMVAFESPRVAALIWGVLLWTAGGEARRQQKKATRLERDLQAERERRERREQEVRDLAGDE